MKFQSVLSRIRFVNHPVSVAIVIGKVTEHMSVDTFDKTLHFNTFFIIKIDCHACYSDLGIFHCRLCITSAIIGSSATIGPIIGSIIGPTAVVPAIRVPAIRVPTIGVPTIGAPAIGATPVCAPTLDINKCSLK